MSTALFKIPRGHNGGLNETNGVARIFCRVAEPFWPTLKPLKCTLLLTDHCLITAKLYQGVKFLTGVHVFSFSPKMWMNVAPEIIIVTTMLPVLMQQGHTLVTAAPGLLGKQN